MGWTDRLPATGIFGSISNSERSNAIIDQNIKQAIIKGETSLGIDLDPHESKLY